MKLLKPAIWLTIAAAAILSAPSATAITVAQLNLEQMVSRSARVFAGRVLDISERRIPFGGGELPAVTYRFEVSESFKGEFEKVEDQMFTEVSMLGTLKNVAGAPHPLGDFPVLQKDREYLLIVAPVGPTGLTTTIGLGQGCFNLTKQGTSKVALNEANNVGLFNGMRSSVRTQDGMAISYATLASMIRTIAGGTQP